MRQLLIIICIAILLPLSLFAKPNYSHRIYAQTFGPTEGCDDLWQIASRVRPSLSVSVQQTEIALLRVNPKAFYKRNINGLMVGYYLRIPSVSFIQRVSKKQAVRMARRQNIAWRKIVAYINAHPTKFHKKLRRLICSPNHVQRMVARIHNAASRVSASINDKIKALKLEVAILKEKVAELTQKNEVLTKRVDELQSMKKTESSQQVISVTPTKKDQITMPASKVFATLTKTAITTPAKKTAVVELQPKKVPTPAETVIQAKQTPMAKTAEKPVSKPFHFRSLASFPFIHKLVQTYGIKNFLIVLGIIIILFLAAILWPTKKRVEKFEKEEKEKLDEAEEMYLMGEEEAPEEESELETKTEEKSEPESKPESKTVLPEEITKEEPIQEPVKEEIEKPEVTAVKKPEVESEKTPAEENKEDDAYQYLSGEDVMASKLDLARAYIDMGDHGSAKQILNSVITDGNEAQRKEAEGLLKKT